MPNLEHYALLSAPPPPPLFLFLLFSRWTFYNFSRSGLEHRIKHFSSYEYSGQSAPRGGARRCGRLISKLCSRWHWFFSDAARMRQAWESGCRCCCWPRGRCRCGLSPSLQPRKYRSARWSPEAWKHQPSHTSVKPGVKPTTLHFLSNIVVVSM